MTTANPEHEAPGLRQRIAVLERAAIASRSRLVDLEEKLREVDLLCESAWLNISAVIPADELPSDFGRLAVSVDEVQEVLRDGSSGIRDVFYQAFLDQLDKRDEAVKVLARLTDHAEAAEDDTVLAVLSALPTDWAFQVDRRRDLTRTGDAVSR